MPRGPPSGLRPEDSRVSVTGPLKGIVGLFSVALEVLAAAHVLTSTLKDGVPQLMSEGRKRVVHTQGRVPSAMAQDADGDGLLLWPICT